jgi:cytochrome c oxidase assembly protein subunit 15
LTAPAPADAPTARRLALGFGALAATTYVLIVLGALVRAHGAGLACPDWPLCFGEVIPELDFKVGFEWGHRVLAGSVGLVFLALAVATLRSPGLGRAMRAGLGIAALLLAVQIVLGGLTVLELLASWTVTSHLVTGNAFALAVVLLSRRLLRLGAAAEAPTAPASPAQRLAVSAAGTLLVSQIVLGGLVSSSYAGLVCPDWPTCMNGEVFPTWRGIQGLHVIHRTVGYTLVVVLAATAWIARGHAGASRWLGVAAVLGVAQVGAGVANVLLRLPVEVTALHSALAAALVCTVGVGVRESFRGTLGGGVRERFRGTLGGGARERLPSTVPR